MNRRTRQSLYVGLTAILGIGFLAFGIGWLSRAIKYGRSMHYTVFFANARGITNGSGVDMSGVGIGSVDNVHLSHGARLDDGTPVPDNSAQLEVSVEPKYHVPQGSQFTIRAPLIGSTPTLTVTANPNGGPDIPNDAKLQGVTSTGVEDLLASAQPLLKDAQPLLIKLQKLTDQTTQLTLKVNDLTASVADPKRQAELRRTVDNIATTTDQLPRLLSKTESQLDSLSAQTNTLLTSLNRAAKGGQDVVAQAGGLTGDLRATLNENRAGLRTLIRNANDTTSSLAMLTSNLSSTIGNPKIQQSLVTASQNLSDITVKLDATADDLNRLSADPRLTQDIRDTAENLRETSASIRNITSRLETIRIPGERRPSSGGTSSSSPAARRASNAATSLLEPGLVLNSVYDTKVSRLRVDTDFTLLTGSRGSFYRAGLYDLSYGNRFDLEAGQAIGGYPANADLRYGLLAGKLGVGTDLRTGPLDLRLDAFDPNHLTLNARAKASLGSDTSLLFGLDNIGSGKDSNRATIGVQIRR